MVQIILACTARGEVNNDCRLVALRGAHRKTLSPAASWEADVERKSFQPSRAALICVRSKCNSSNDSTLMSARQLLRSQKQCSETLRDINFHEIHLLVDSSFARTLTARIHRLR